MRERKYLLLAITACLMSGALYGGTISAFNDYPTADSTTDMNGITMSNRAAWIDDSHSNNNYNANLDITINGLVNKKSFNEPIDVQIIQDVSTSMDEMCYQDSHVTFQYHKKITEGLDSSQLSDMRIKLETYLRDKLATKKATGKDDWISIAGMQDKDGKTFSKDAYLVPMNSFYLADSWADFSKKDVYPTDFEKRYFIVDNPVASKDDSGLNTGTAYWANKYHAKIDENGVYHSLSIVADPVTATDIHFGFFNKETAIKSNCKSYTTTAYNLLSNFGSALFNANADNHLSMNSFSEVNQYTSPFAKNQQEYESELIKAFNQTSGATNYEAGLLAGKNNLQNHNDSDGRKKYVIFISDGRPNKALDKDGNAIDYSDMTNLMNLSGELRKDGIEVYTVGFCVEQYINDTYLMPMATDEKHSYFRTPDQLDKMVEIYDLIQARVIEDTYIKSTIENTISKYYTVDKDNLPSDIALFEQEQVLDDGSTRTVQKIRYHVKTEDLDDNGINTKTIPLILKEEYRNTNEYYPTNDEEKNGANAIYENLDATKHNIAVKTPWLSVNTKVEKTHRIDTEVINGTITESLMQISSGENRTISYTPKDNYVLKSIIVDGKEVDTEKYKTQYLFENINDNHFIKVIYEKNMDGDPETPVEPNNPSTTPKEPLKPENQTIDSVDTGDTINPIAYSVGLMGSILILIVIVINKKRENHKSIK